MRRKKNHEKPLHVTRNTRAGLLLFCLCACIPAAGCSAGRQPLTVTRPEAVLPPAALLRATPVPEWRGTTNGDLERYARRLAAALDSANADKDALRRWRGQMEAIHMGKENI